VEGRACLDDVKKKFCSPESHLQNNSLQIIRYVPQYHILAARKYNEEGQNTYWSDFIL
jgi:hypothetical protein